MRKIALAIIVMCSIIVSGCSVQKEGKQEIPKTAYEEVGYGVKGEVLEDGTVLVTYALVGIEKGVIRYLYLDQIENHLQKDRHLFTNQELRSAYGLSYKSEKGEWSEQVGALQSYIKTNNMTLDDVNALEVYQKDKQNLKVPKEGTGLAMVCELDISDFLDVINEACNNLQETEALRLGVGEDIRVSKKDNRIDIHLAFMGTDYRYKICYANLETYSIVAEQGVEIDLQKSVDAEYRKGIDSFEEYILGLNMLEAIGVETYDPGNGIETALPKKGTDLAEVCNVDLKRIIKAVEEAGSRF